MGGFFEKKETEQATRAQELNKKLAIVDKNNRLTHLTYFMFLFKVDAILSMNFGYDESE